MKWIAERWASQKYLFCTYSVYIKRIQVGIHIQLVSISAGTRESELPLPVEFHGKPIGGKQEKQCQSYEQKGYLQIRRALKS